MRALALVVVVVVAGAAGGCASPLASRRARVMPVGEVEVAAVPYLEAGAGEAAWGGEKATARRDDEITLGRPDGIPVPVELVARTGIAPGFDAQARLDATGVPEITLGAQIAGDPAREDVVAVTVAGGLKPLLVPVYVFVNGVVAAPLEVICDIPFAETDAVTLGVRGITTVSFSTLDGGGFAGTPAFERGARFAFEPGAFAAVHLQHDASGFFVRPEVAANTLIVPVDTFAGAGTLAPRAWNVVGALDVGFRFDVDTSGR